MTGTRPPERFRPLRELGIVVIGADARPPDGHLPGIPYLATHTRPPSLCLLAISGIALFSIIGNVSTGPVGTPAPPPVNDTIPLVAPAAW
ncbi:MAG TPA: hypothetical protein VMR14_09020 [Streptosporangiaceae bacterium]|jgi:hypothetical protein|nr:hypothetical protein [Streptosporangiaceae bacterium]